MDGEDKDYNLYCVKTNQNTKKFSLSFAGTISVGMDSRIRVAVKGVDDGSYQILKNSMFSLLKIQPDFKTPGLITDLDIQQFDGFETAIKQWSDTGKMGLIVR